MKEEHYKSELCDLIKEYTKRDKGSEGRISEFLQVNSLKALEDCSEIKAIDLLYRIETFMAIERLRVRAFI